MKIRKTLVTKTNGKRSYLLTDDTLTLAFPKMIESTPATLRAAISEKSLRRIAQRGDSNEISKAGKSLELRCQLSAHGAGRHSVFAPARGRGLKQLL